MARRDEIVLMVARLAAAQLGVPQEKLADVEANIVAVVNGELSRLFGGTRIELTTCRVPHEKRAARNARILAAVQRGEAVAAVAKREGVSPRLVRWLRQSVRVDIAAPSQHDGGSR